MFDPKAEIADAVEAVYAIVEPLKRGEILTHETIAEVLGLQPHRGHWDLVVGKVRRRLREERGIACWPENGVGYKLLTPTEQLQSCSWYSQKAKRSVNRGLRNAEATPDSHLTPNQRRIKAFVADQARELRRELGRKTRSLGEQLRPSATMPRPTPAPPVAVAERRAKPGEPRP